MKQIRYHISVSTRLRVHPSTHPIATACFLGEEVLTDSAPTISPACAFFKVSFDSEFQVTGMIEGIFWEIFDLGLFGVGNFSKYFFFLSGA